MSSYTLVNVACTFFSSIIIILIRTQITHTEQKQNFLQKQKKIQKKIQKKCFFSEKVVYFTDTINTRIVNYC